MCQLKFFVYSVTFFWVFTHFRATKGVSSLPRINSSCKCCECVSLFICVFSWWCAQAVFPAFLWMHVEICWTHPEHAQEWIMIAWVNKNCDTSTVNVFRGHIRHLTSDAFVLLHLLLKVQKKIKFVSIHGSCHKVFFLTLFHTAATADTSDSYYTGMITTSTFHGVWHIYTEHVMRVVWRADITTSSSSQACEKGFHFS